MNQTSVGSIPFIAWKNTIIYLIVTELRGRGEQHCNFD